MLKQNHIKADPVRIRNILSKSLELQSLDLTEISDLIMLQDTDLWSEVFDAARRVKEKVYGRRVVLFAPLYLSNECTNDCLYCGFRKGNKDAHRKTLDVDEAVQEASLLSERGYKRLLLVTSEHNKLMSMDYFEKVIDAVYRETDIRILHMNSAPMSIDGFRRLKAAFRTWDAVAKADRRAVAAAIRVSGLANIKSGRIQEILRRVHADCGRYSLESLRRKQVDSAMAIEPTVLRG